MQKLMQKHQKFLKGNAGFSLVELIIVIAIMAALIAILAPQYLKYVERSRISADETNADQLLGAVKVICSDPDYVVPAPSSDTTYTITWNASDDGKYSVPSVTLATGVTLANALDSSLGIATGSAVSIPKSSLHKAQTYTVTITFASDTISSITGAWA